NRNATTMTMLHQASGRKEGASATIGFSLTPALAIFCWGAAWVLVCAGGNRNTGNRLRNFAINTPATAPQVVQIMEGPPVAVGFTEFAPAKMAMTATGTS